MKLTMTPLLPDGQIAERILVCNSVSARFGLTLTRAQALELAHARSHALVETGRVEFSGGILEDLIFAFCDSPYITAEQYADTLQELIRLFYVFKSETLDQVPDDELIQLMKQAFDGPPCYGNLELLEGKVLSEVGRQERFRGLPQEEDDEDEDEDDEEQADA